MRVLLSLIITSALLLACDADTLIWMPLHDRADPLFRFISGGRAGFIDRTGKVVVPPTLPITFNTDQVFYDGLMSLTFVAQPAFLDVQGRTVLDKGFDAIYDFSEGLALARQTYTSPWGFIDRSGTFVIPPQFPDRPKAIVNSFSDGLAAIEVAGKLGYIDRSGNYVIKPQFAAGTDFNAGVARVVAKGSCKYVDPEYTSPCGAQRLYAPLTGPQVPGTITQPCKWRFIDKTGKQIIAAEFDTAWAFHEGLAAVKVRGLWGYIDLTGNFVIPPSFQSAYSFSDGLALVEKDNQKVFIDKKGNVSINLSSFFEVHTFSEGLALIHRPGGYTFINTRGEEPIKEKFVLASDFFHGLAHVKLRGDRSGWSGGTFAYIDRTGKRVFTYEW